MNNLNHSDPNFEDPKVRQMYLRGHISGPILRYYAKEKLLGEDERRVVEHHLSVCEDCRNRVADINLIAEAWKDLEGWIDHERANIVQRESFEQPRPTNSRTQNTRQVPRSLAYSMACGLLIMLIYGVAHIAGLKPAHDKKWPEQGHGMSFQASIPADIPKLLLSQTTQLIQDGHWPSPEILINPGAKVGTASVPNGSNANDINIPKTYNGVFIGSAQFPIVIPVGIRAQDITIEYWDAALSSWQAADNVRTFTSTNARDVAHGNLLIFEPKSPIPPGDYKWRARASTGSGMNTASAVVRLTLLPESCRNNELVQAVAYAHFGNTTMATARIRSLAERLDRQGNHRAASDAMKLLATLPVPSHS